ncbi:MAG: SpoIIE family protein phosphatase [Armatimonadota bacterium]
MSTPLRLMIVEDSEDDALLVIDALRSSGYDLVWQRVETREEMVSALETKGWDVIISDYRLPNFSGLDALKLVCARDPDIPFIIISGQITEDTAVAAMRAGAHDYVLKDNLVRLVPAVERELRDAEFRRRQKFTEEIFAKVFRSAPVMISISDLETGQFADINETFERLIGYSRDELIGKTSWDIDMWYDPSERAELVQELDRQGSVRNYEARFRTKSGQPLIGLLSGDIISLHGRRSMLIAITDITERKKVEDVLDAERRRLQAVLDALPVGVFIADRNGRVFQANNQVSVIWGGVPPMANSVDDYGNYPAWWADTGEPVSSHEWPMAAALRGETTVGEIISIERVDGKEATVFNSAAPIRDASGEVIGAVTVVQDISELIALRRELERALDEARQEGERVRALEGIAEAGIATTDLQELLDILVLRMAETLHAHSSSIWMFDDERYEFEARAEYGASGLVGESLDVDNGVAGIVYHERKFVFTPDAENDPRVKGEIIKKQGAKSLIAVPLITRGRVIGMAHVDMSETREFTEDEIGLIEAMASRAAQAIDNIKLYDALTRSRNDLENALNNERHFSLLLQKALLPGIPDIGAGYSVAAEYVPVYIGRSIGGDFYDVFQIGDDKAGVLIGDVSGKGLEAAAMAATTRSTVHAFVHEMASSSESLEKANSVLALRQSDFSPFVTVFLAIIDLNSGEITYSNAGHPPAAICRANGSVELLKSGQLPLSLLEGQKYNEYSSYMEPGDKLVLYTDGINEARQSVELLGFEGILQILSENFALHADMLARALVDSATNWSRGKLRDDAAVVVVERGRDEV